MAKKCLLVLILAGVLAGGIFAQEAASKGAISLSAGVGGYFTSDFGGGIEVSGEPSIKTPYAGGGAFLFFDASYVELSMGFFGGGGKTTIEIGSRGSRDRDASYMGLDIGLLGKYPITINEKMSVFPLLGITYRVMLSAKDEDGNESKNRDGEDNAGDYSALWFKLGGGADFSLTDKIYLHSGLLYGLRLANKAENDMIDGNSDAKARLGHGLEVKVAVGFRF
ncbi:MAG: hypothetical protein LBH18_03105 [Spirochaetaceae bacterium]|jgi:hypothetical protein|nr:hypothetical protein [Spirochaetaceae bacterium]